MKFTKNKALWAFILVAALAVCQLGLTGSGLVGEKEMVHAAPETAIIEGIPASAASGGAWTVDPAMMVEGLVMSANTVDSVTLAWTYAGTTEAQFYIFQYNEQTDTYQPIATTGEKTYKATGLEAGKAYYYVVCPYNAGLAIQGANSAYVQAYTKPVKVGTVTISENTSTTLTLSWPQIPGVLGYEISRAKGDGSYATLDTVGSDEALDGVVTYLDTNLDTARAYRYKIRAYAVTDANYGAYSAAVKSCTLPATPSLTIKGGDTKVRISWKAIARATGYHIYSYDETEGTYQLLDTLVGKNNKVYVHKNLENDERYQYVVVAYRTIWNMDFDSMYSDMLGANTGEVAPTSTKPKLYKNKKQLKASDAYKKCKTLKKLNYGKSFILPGLINTNVDGFYSGSMCPQGITFAGSYMLLSSYDLTSIENSVIYVLKKSTGKLVTTLILPSKVHAGGIAYDGTNIWVTHSSTVRAFPFSQVKKAVASKKPSYQIDKFKTEITLTHKAGSLAYYKSKLWVGVYDELKSGTLNAYTIQNKKATPTLAKLASVKIPTKVQGFAFTSDGKLVLSRSCQTNPKMRGYSHMVDTYKPNLKKLSNGTITLGKKRNSVDMPSMNEEIAVQGNYLYVTFESGAFASAIRRMDRVCAFKIKDVTK